jgi:Superinfection immunity protein
MIIGGILLVFFYFIPSFVGFKKRNFSAIFVLNLFLGWTFIGWIVALIWAVSYEKPI